MRRHVAPQSCTGLCAGRCTLPRRSGSKQGVALNNINTHAAAYTPPLPLPPPPTDATLTKVLPYLTKVACSERGMVLRLSAAFLALMIAKGTGLAAPFFFKNAVDKLAMEGSAAMGLQACVMGVVMYGAMRLISQLSKELQMPLFTPIAQAVSRRVAHHTFRHVLELDVKFHLERRTGQLSRVLERGTRSTQMLFRTVVFTLMPTAIELALVCATLGNLFNNAVVLTVAATFVAYVAWTLHFIKLQSDMRKSLNDLDAATSGKAVDALLNYETVTLFNNQAQEVTQYDMFLTKYQMSMNRVERLAATMNAGQAAITNTGIVASLVAAAMLSPTPVTPGDLILIQGILLQLWAPLQFFGWFFRELRQSLVDMEDFLKILQIKPDAADGTEELNVPAHRYSAFASLRASPPQAAAEDASLQSRNGHASAHSTAESSSSSANGNGSSNGNGRKKSGMSIEFENVDFAYTETRQILRGLSLKIKAGQRVAIVGPSGSGKSTVLKLLARLYRPSSGTITVQGQNINDVLQASLREHLAVVPQDTVLFSDSIKENIRYGRLDATDAEVEAAVRMAHLDAAVDRMPDGLDTAVGERGLKLSGGEKQRVAIARAFLRDPLLLICDESTSALDTTTEQGIMESLDDLSSGRTSVFVAHRLSTVMNCDNIFVMSGGRVVEQGTHAQLLAAGGMYKSMWDTQVGEDEKERHMRERDIEQQCRHPELYATLASSN